MFVFFLVGCLVIRIIVIDSYIFVGIYFREVFCEVFVVFFDFLFELLNFFIGVNFILEFDGVFFFLLMMSLLE